MQFGDVQQTKNPAVKFINWRGGFDKGFFSGYDPIKEEKIEKFKLGEFVLLNTGFQVAGWHGAHDTGIYSNYIQDFDNPFMVRLSPKKEGDKTVFNGGELAEGKWKDIKDAVKTAGGYLQLTLDVFHEGEIIQLQLKGTGYAAFNNFIKGFNYTKNTIKTDGAEDGKQGAIKWKFPKFTTGAEITEDQGKSAKEALAEIREFLTAKEQTRREKQEEFNKSPEEKEKEEVEKEKEDGSSELEAAAEPLEEEVKKK